MSLEAIACQDQLIRVYVVHYVLVVTLEATVYLNQLILVLVVHNVLDVT